MWLPKYPASLCDDSVKGKWPLLMLQAWHDFLSPGSTDSYQARTLDLSLLLEDILHVVAMSSSDDRWKAYLPDLSRELSEQINVESRLLKKNPRLKGALLAAATELLAGKSPDLIQQKIELAKTFFGDPIKCLVDDFKSIVASPCMDPKKDMLERLSTLATHVLYRGVGDESLQLIDDKLLRQSPDVVIDILLSPLNDLAYSYKCFIGVKGSEKTLRSIIKDTDFRFKRTSDIRADELSQLWLQQFQGVNQLVLTISANSPRAAAELMLKSISSILHMHNLHANNASFFASPKLLVYKLDHIETYAIEVTPSKHFGLLPRKNNQILTQQRLKEVSSRIEGRLAHALESHTLAMAASDPRTAILNFWTALETIVGSSGPANIGLRVASKIAPHMAWRKADKLVTYLALNCHEYHRYMLIPVNTAVFTRSTKHKISPDDILTALTGPSGNLHIETLLKTLASSPLLANRFLRAWEIFNDPVQLKKNLEATKNRIEWQILRLYRARNLLIHRGQESHLIWRLLPHAQYYVSMTLSRVMQDMQSFHGWMVDNAVIYQSVRFGELCRALVENRETLTHRDLLSEKSAAPTVLLWPQPVR